MLANCLLQTNSDETRSEEVDEDQDGIQTDSGIQLTKKVFYVC